MIVGDNDTYYLTSWMFGVNLEFVDSHLVLLDFLYLKYWFCRVTINHVMLVPLIIYLHWAYFRNYLMS